MQKRTGMLCRDVLSLCDGYNCAFGNDYAFCCMLEADHDEPHRDEFEHEGKSIVITWQDTNESTVPIANSQHLLFVRQIKVLEKRRSENVS